MVLFFTINSDFEIIYLHSIGQQPIGALGTDAPANFGGICYPGSGDIVVLATTASISSNHGDFLFYLSNGKLVLLEQGNSALVGYNFKTGKNDWVVLRGSDRAVGIQCGSGFAFALEPGSQQVLAINTLNGDIAFALPAPGCDSSVNYNCAEVIAQGEYVVVSTNFEFSRYRLVNGTSNVVINTTNGELPAWDEKPVYDFPNEYPSDAFFLHHIDENGTHGFWISSDFPHPGGSIQSQYQFDMPTADGNFVKGMRLCDQFDVSTNHGPAHVQNGEVKFRVQEYTARYMVGYSTTGNVNDFVVDKNPFAYFNLPIVCNI